MSGLKLNHDSLHLALGQRVGYLREYLRRRMPKSLCHVLSADDLLQEVWIAAYRTVDDFQANEPGAVDRWLITLARTKLIDAVRAARRLKRGGHWQHARYQVNRTSTFAGVFAWLQSPERTPSRDAHLADTAQRILIALERLDDRQRRAVELRYLSGLPRARIAQELGTTEKAVQGLLARGLDRLHELLGPAFKYFTDARSADEARDNGQA